MDKKKVFYWSPYLNHIGTINAVVHSAEAMKEIGWEPSLIRSFSEWKHVDNLNIEEFFFARFFKERLKLPSKGIFYRLSMIMISFLAIIPLIQLAKKNKDCYFITNLVAAIPLLLIGNKVKIIASIQGKPKFTILRKFFWSFLYTKAKVIIAMTEESKTLIENKNINLNIPVKVIKNAVVNEETLKLSNQKMPKELQDHFLKKTKNILAVGRLTKQKNFSLLIKSFVRFIRENKIKNVQLNIIGDGERLSMLESIINELNAQSIVHLLGHQNNPYTFMKNSDLLICSSLWEDPGHILMESGIIRCPILSADCPSGPIEFLKKGKAGILFESDNEDDLVKKLTHIHNDLNYHFHTEMLDHAVSSADEYSAQRHAVSLEALFKSI